MKNLFIVGIYILITSCLNQNEKSTLNKFNGIYELEVVIGDNKEGKVGGIDGNMRYDYILEVKNDTSYFTGMGHMTYFNDLCLNKLQSDTLYIFYQSTVEGTCYNNSYSPVIKLYKINGEYFLDSEAIETGGDINRRIRVVKKDQVE